MLVGEEQSRGGCKRGCIQSPLSAQFLNKLLHDISGEFTEVANSTLS